MDFSTLQGFLCGTGVALIAYSRTFPRWLRERATVRYLQAQETIKTMEAKLKEYEKIQPVMVDIEKEAASQGVFSSKKKRSNLS